MSAATLPKAYEPAEPVLAAGHPVRIGILGGLGPLASALFQQRLVHSWARVANAREDDDFPQILHYSGALPGLDAAGMSDWEHLLGASSKALQLFDVFKPNIIAIPCNSVLELAPTLEKRFHVPVLSPWRCAPTVLNPTKVAVLCSASLRVQLRQVLPTLVLPNEEDQVIVQTAIEQVMAGRSPRTRAIQALIDKFLKSGAEEVRLACTELSCLQLPPIPQVLDTMDYLVQSTIKTALQLQNL